MDGIILYHIIFLFIIHSTTSTDSCEDDSGIAVVSDEGFVTGSCQKSHIEKAIRSNKRCHLTDIVVELPWPNNTDIQQMTPTHVAVQMCEGSCYQSGGQTCVAQKTRQRRIPVILGRCGINEGTCEKECATVTIEEHTECGCACKLKEEDCPKVTHKLKQSTCTCECKNIQAKRECLDGGRIWTESDCSCGCPIITSLESCPTGSFYDKSNTCSCVPFIDAENDKRITEYKDSTSDKNLEPENQMISWEMLVIIILLVILFLLSVVVIVLSIKLVLLKKKLSECSQRVVPSTLSGQYLPCPDPSTDMLKQRHLQAEHQSAISDRSSSEASGTYQHFRMLEPATDSSLCSDQDESQQLANELSEGSSESLARLRQSGYPNPCPCSAYPQGTLHSPTELRPSMPLYSDIAHSSPSPYNLKHIYAERHSPMRLNNHVMHSPESVSLLHSPDNPYNSHNPHNPHNPHPM